MVLNGLKIGEMRSVVKMLKNVPTASTSGGAFDAYGIIVTTRGRLRRFSGFRNLTFGEIVNSENYEVCIYYQNDVANNLRVDTKFLIDGLIYTMQGYELVQEIKAWYRIRLAIDKSGSVTIVAPSPINAGAGVLAIWVTTTPGAWTVISSLLVGATILGVDRSSVSQELVSGTPGNAQVSFSGTTLTFDSTNPFNSGEIVYVLYRVP